MKRHRSMSEDTKKKISAARTGFRLTEETKKKISAAKTGIRLTEEHRQHISEGKKGTPMPEEVKKKISEAAKGTYPDIIARQKMSLAWDKKPFIQCPHCVVESKSMSLMLRYHFDNCKKRSLHKTSRV